MRLLGRTHYGGLDTTNQHEGPRASVPPCRAQSQPKHSRLPCTVELKGEQKGDVVAFVVCPPEIYWRAGLPILLCFT
jgi:hypothetical protein